MIAMVPKMIQAPVNLMELELHPAKKSFDLKGPVVRWREEMIFLRKPSELLLFAPVADVVSLVATR